jgi:uncharacterized membrane protein HdeD (DUF308 family)
MNSQAGIGGEAGLGGRPHGNKEIRRMSVVPQGTIENPYITELRALRGNWVWFLLLGIALVIVGMLALGQPFLTALAGETVFAIMVLVAAGVEIASAIWAGRWRGFFFHMLSGLLYLVLGMYMIERPFKSILVLALVLAAAFMAKGVLGIIIALTQRFHSWPWVLFSSLISLALGIFIWMKWPSDAAWILAVYIGVEIIFLGWSWVMLAVASRSIPTTPAQPTV